MVEGVLILLSCSDWMCEEVSEIVTRLVAPDAHLVSPESKQLESGLASYRVLSRAHWGIGVSVQEVEAWIGFYRRPIISKPKRFRSIDRDLDRHIDRIANH